MAPSRGRSRAACTAARSCKRMHKCYVRTLELSTKNVDCQVLFRGAKGLRKCLDGRTKTVPSLVQSGPVLRLSFMSRRFVSVALATLGLSIAAAAHPSAATSAQPAATVKLGRHIQFGRVSTRKFVLADPERANGQLKLLWMGYEADDGLLAGQSSAPPDTDRQGDQAPVDGHAGLRPLVDTLD